MRSFQHCIAILLKRMRRPALFLSFDFFFFYCVCCQVQDCHIRDVWHLHTCSWYVGPSQYAQVHLQCSNCRCPSLDEQLIEQLIVLITNNFSWPCVVVPQVCPWRSTYPDRVWSRLVKMANKTNKSNQSVAVINSLWGRWKVWSSEILFSLLVLPGPDPYFQCSAL